MSDPLSDFETITVRNPDRANNVMYLSPSYGRIKVSVPGEFILTTELIDGLIGALEQARPAVGMIDLQKIDATLEKKKQAFDIKHAESEKARLEYESVVAMRDRLINEVGLYIPAKES